MFKKEEKEQQMPNPEISAQQNFLKEKQQKQEQTLNLVKHQITELVRMLRTLEDRYNNLLKKVQLTDQNMLHEHKRLNKELKIVDSDLIDSKKELNELDYKFGLIIRELELCAKRQDVNLVKKYIELWQPTSFIRKNDAEKIIDQLLKDKIKKKEKVIK